MAACFSYYFSTAKAFAYVVLVISYIILLGSFYGGLGGLYKSLIFLRLCGVGRGDWPRRFIFLFLPSGAVFSFMAD